jgi:hypothetical protein
MSVAARRIEGIVERAGRLQARLEAAGIRARLLGGVGVAILLGSRLSRRRREYETIDLAVPGRHRADLRAVLGRLGYVAVNNVVHSDGEITLYGRDGTRLDVIFDVLRGAHVIDPTHGFDHPGATLPSGLLLLTKLQMVELSARDRGDVAALLTGCELDKVGLRPIAQLCAADWGLWRTVARSLRTVMKNPPLMTAERRNQLELAVTVLFRRLEEEPKSLRWRIRSRIGSALVA